MAKKVRRVKKKRQQKKEAASVVAEDSAAAVEVSEDASNTHHSTVDQFQLEYAYVAKDLRRVLILAAVMFALLIALNLLLS